MPILYLPYFSHPDPSVKRRSGFLTPEYSNSTTLGYTAEVPYYFALAPNYDFTFTPRISSKHGTLWMGDWRHRLASEISAASTRSSSPASTRTPSTLDDIDPATARPARRLARQRRDQGLFSLSSWWRFGWDITLESDDQFRRFYKLDNILQTDRVNTRLPAGHQRAQLLRRDPLPLRRAAAGRPAAAESRVHPVIDYSYILEPAGARAAS